MQPIPIHPRRPLWTDRQLITAADLTAEQTLQDARLARLRRYALGWGVVAGFEVVIDTQGLRIRAGYGISPLGAEVYLADDLLWPEALTHLVAACAPGPAGICDQPGPRSSVSVDETLHEAWIVLRPETLVSCPRAHVPAGCASAGNDWAYSRQTGALQIDVVCSLDAGLLPDARGCDTVQTLFAGGDVPLPPDLPDMLPLAHVSFSALGLFTVSTATRRRLLPLSELQAALACCDCAPPGDAGNDLPQNDDVTDSVWDAPFDHALGDLLDDFEGALPAPRKDLRLRLAQIFADETSPFVRPHAGFLRDPLQACAAAAMVTRMADFDDWQAGRFSDIFDRLRGLNIGGIRLPGMTDLSSQTLAQLLARTQNIEALKTGYGTTPVKDVPVIELAAAVLDEARLTPGAAAMLGFVQLRLAQMFQG